MENHICALQLRGGSGKAYVPRVDADEGHAQDLASTLPLAALTREFIKSTISAMILTDRGRVTPLLRRGTSKSAHRGSLKLIDVGYLGLLHHVSNEISVAIPFNAQERPVGAGLGRGLAR